MKINKHKLSELVRNAIKVKGTSLAAESEALGWSKNRLGQCLAEDTQNTWQTVFNICQHFDLPLEEVVTDATNTMAYMPLGHVFTDSSRAFGRRRYYSVSGMSEIYIDTYVTLRLPQGTLHLHPGARLRVAATKEVIEGNTYAVANEGEGFKVKEWCEVDLNEWDLSYVITSIGVLQENSD